MFQFRFFLSGIDYLHEDLRHSYVSLFSFCFIFKKVHVLTVGICVLDLLSSPNLQIPGNPSRNVEHDSGFIFQNAKASYDFSSNDPYPYPRYTDTWFNR